MDEAIRLVSSGDDVKIWNSSSMTVVEQFNPHSITHPVSRVCWSSNNHFLVSASASGDKLVVSSCKSSPVPVLELAEEKRQTRVSLNSTSQFMVSGGLDCTVNIWDLKTKKLHRSLKDHKEEVTCVAFNGSDSYIASGSTSGEIILHSITTNLSSKPFGHGPNQPIHDLKYSYFKKSLLGSVSDSGSVVLWDANTQKDQHTFEGAHKAPASGLAFSPANELLFVTVGLDKKIICYDTSSKIVLRSLRVESPLTAIDFMPDGAVLAVGSSQGKVYLYDLRMLTSAVKTVAAHKTSVHCLRFQNTPSHHKSGSKALSSKTSTAQSAPNKRAAVKTVDNNGPSSLATSPAPPSHTEPPPGSRGDRGDGKAEGTGIPHSTSLDVFPSKETEALRSSEKVPSLDRFNSVGRNSLDIFSPVRDDYKTQKASGDYKKGDVLDFLSQFSSTLPARRTPLGTPGVQGYSPMQVFDDSPRPVREQEEEEMTEKPKAGRPEPVLHDTKQADKIGSPGSELSPQHARTSELSQRRGKDVQAELLYDTPKGAPPAAPTPAASSAIAAGLASSLSERIAESIGGEGGGAPPLTAIQIHFIRNMIQETLEDFREACHRDIVNLQVEMIRQFYIQLNEIHSLIEKYSVTDSLVAEIERLKEENKRLRTNF
uniref:NEDD1 gamma-tubulin ring complex targeting factor n=1 Tax=Lepisosteus oculatus TaxID=7918 RepID=W5NE38_LEPOC|nr:PREDICTED: protein NEDD1 [Lepisosteus oculatus]